MNKTNYMPISVIPTLSKIFEGILVDQMSDEMENIFAPHLSGFRKHRSSQSVIVKLCKFTPDNNTYGAVLTDLSKTFDRLPHQLVINKLDASGFHNDACMLIASYFTWRNSVLELAVIKVSGQQ